MDDAREMTLTRTYWPGDENRPVASPGGDKGRTQKRMDGRRSALDLHFFGSFRQASALQNMHCYFSRAQTRKDRPLWTWLTPRSNDENLYTIENFSGYFTLNKERKAIPSQEKQCRLPL